MSNYFAFQSIGGRDAGGKCLMIGLASSVRRRHFLVLRIGARQRAEEADVRRIYRSELGAKLHGEHLATNMGIAPGQPPRSAIRALSLPLRKRQSLRADTPMSLRPANRNCPACATHSQIFVDGLTRLVDQLKPNCPPVLFWRIVVPSIEQPLGATSSIWTATTSQSPADDFDPEQKSHAAATVLDLDFSVARRAGTRWR